MLRPGTERDRLLPAALLLAALTGYAASIAGFLEYRGSIGVCEGLPSPGVALDCSRVYSIPQARLLGVVHLSEAAVAYFTLLALAAIAYYPLGSRLGLKAALALSLLGAPIVPYLVYLEIWVAEAICAWCTVMHASILACAGLSALCLRLQPQS